MIDIILNQNRCQGSKCGKCAYVCPNNVFTITDVVTVTSPVYCKMCQECLEICPEAAIIINIPDHDKNTAEKIIKTKNRNTGKKRLLKTY
ncbi:DUF362 domain-containing protein [Methanobacterium formicicum]|nr:ferredoxin [Methanobacterium formicicum]